METNTQSTPVTNLDYLVSLSKGNGKFVRDMIGFFLEENPKEVQLLEQAIWDKKPESIYAAAHKMKSTIVFAGLDKIIDGQLTEIEKIAMTNGELPGIEEHFKKVKDACEKAWEELRRMEERI